MKKGKIILKGDFLEYFLKSMGILCLAVITLGILAPYYIYWNFKYFAQNLEIEIDE